MTEMAKDDKLLLVRKYFLFFIYGVIANIFTGPIPVNALGLVLQTDVIFKSMSKLVNVRLSNMMLVPGQEHFHSFYCQDSCFKDAELQ